jgi:pimeloyl-ACP methyl ester carboxylesterase
LRAAKREWRPRAWLNHGGLDALVLVHGAMGDYRWWGHQVESFSRRYRVFSYSRRYSYPNRNRAITPDHSAITEADDLAVLVAQLGLRRAHFVGHSYGAYTALALALARPDMPRTLVLAEPPVHRWIRDVPEGEALFEEIMSTVWAPVKKAFEQGDAECAIRLFTDGMGGPGDFDRLPPGARAARLQNARALEALTRSSDAFPALSQEGARRLALPTLVVEGEQTIRIHRLVDDELLRCIPDSERAIIPEAGHGAPRDNPDAFNEAVLSFLNRH